MVLVSPRHEGIIACNVIPTDRRLRPQSLSCECKLGMCNDVCVLAPSCVLRHTASSRYWFNTINWSGSGQHTQFSLSIYSHKRCIHSPYLPEFSLDPVMCISSRYSPFSLDDTAMGGGPSVPIAYCVHSLLKHHYAKFTMYVCE